MSPSLFLRALVEGPYEILQRLFTTKKSNACCGRAYLNFDKMEYQYPVPYVIFADFECLIVKTQTCQLDRIRSFTQNISNHEPYDYAYVVIGPNY